MVRIPDNIVAFSGGNTDLYSAWVDYFNHYKNEFQKKNVDYDHSMSFAEKTDKLDKAIKAEIAKAAGSNNSNFSDEIFRNSPNYKWATYAVIGAMIDIILPDTIIEDFANIAEVRVGAWGDNFAFDIESNDLFTVTQAGQGRRNAFAQRAYTNQVTLTPTSRMITVEEDLYRILSGKVNLAEWVLKCTRSIETEMSIDVFTALDSTYGSLLANFQVNGYTQSAFTTLAQTVTATNFGAQCVCFGTKNAISQILPANDFLKMQLGDTYSKLGYITTFFGVDIFEVPQRINWLSGTYNFALNDQHLYFISTSAQKLIKVGLEGDLLAITDAATDNANLVQTTTLIKKYGVILASNAKYGILSLNGS